MDARMIYLPALALVVLTFAVAWAMYFSRAAQMRRGRIHPQKVATSAKLAALLEDSRAADNFRNLFELPVLFYFGVVVVDRLDMVDGISVALAWAFVLLRVVHTAIHVTYNRVMHRFGAYAAGAIVLMLFWAYLAVGLLSG